MKSVLFLFVFLITVGLAAQNTPEAGLSAAVEKLNKAMLDGNRAVLSDITADKLSYGHSSGLIEDKATFVEALGSGKSDFITLQTSDQTIGISGKTAWVRHKLVAKVSSGATPFDVNLGVMLIWQRKGKNWKLLARQAFRLP